MRLTMTNGKEIKEYKELYNILDDLFEEEKYEEVIQIRDKYTDSFLFDPDKEEYDDIVEIFSCCYIDLDMFDEAMKLINPHIDYIKKRGHQDAEGLKALTSFFQFKITVYRERKQLIKAYRTVNEYIAIGGKDEMIIIWKEEVEDELFIKYLDISIIFAGVVLVIILFDSIQIRNGRGNFFSSFTYIYFIFILLQVLFRKQVERLFIKMLRWLMH